MAIRGCGLRFDAKRAHGDDEEHSAGHQREGEQAAAGMARGIAHADSCPGAASAVRDRLGLSNSHAAIGEGERRSEGGRADAKEDRG